MNFVRKWLQVYSIIWVLPVIFLLLPQQLFRIRLGVLFEQPLKCKGDEVQMNTVLMPLLCTKFALKSERMLGMNVPGSVHLFAYFWRTKALKTTDP